MDDFYAVKLNGIFMTDNGLEDGELCRLEIPNLGDLLLNETGSTIVSVSRKPVTQLKNLGAMPVNIEFVFLHKNVFNSVRAAVNDYATTGAIIQLEFSGSIGTFNFNVVPNYPGAVTFNEFSGDYLQGVSFKFLTA